NASPDKAGPDTALALENRHWRQAAAPSDDRSRASGCRRRREDRRSWQLILPSLRGAKATKESMRRFLLRGSMDCFGDARNDGYGKPDQAATTSSVTPKNLTRSIRPKLVVSATSAASRPVAIRIRPIRGWLWRASKVNHWPDR